MCTGARQDGDFLGESNKEKIWETETVGEKKPDGGQRERVPVKRMGLMVA